MSNFHFDQPLSKLESLIQLTTLSNIWFQLNETSSQSLATMSWGRFIYPYSGTIEIEHSGHQLLAPTPYGIWLPPKTQNERYIYKPENYCTVFISEEFSNSLPSQKCTLLCTPIISSILEYFKENHSIFESISSLHQTRLLQVLVDQLTCIKASGSYVPLTHHSVLSKVLSYLKANSSEKINTNELANLFNITERTLNRYCQSELGMTLIEWRQRKKVIIAIRKLEEGKSVDSIAKLLNYSSTTAFINMFKRLTNLTPEQFRKFS
ncbi:MULTISPECIES: AraC family transcriptional regulator [Acinetobacter calcoaceticus/baumannii complex]|uniref:AraC family transcriptional regulator n=1 Tax=Acinetobacter calcoaceticus/baumannii complex TaxID=909768 RepID=UPI0024471D8A|nr:MULTISPECIES: AraC family transcriptional regulator [Acinetobacter calcoaceticus/baumannii complex]MDH2595928.1 AraC family transcriptional regulator [Acinetobacter baumannii]MDO7536697.1 AraC family transcriptional regulator [Acinetobacter pittii]